MRMKKKKMQCHKKFDDDILSEIKPFEIFAKWNKYQSSVH